MASLTERTSHPERFHIPTWLGLCFFLGVAMFFLWEEHEAHILGVLPYLLLLACPIVHLFMHRGHGGHRAGHSDRDTPPDHRPDGEA